MATKTPVAAMQARCISALYDADPLGGTFADDLIPRLSKTGNEKRSWAVLLDLCEAGRVIQASPGGPHGGRYSLTAEEADDEFMRRYAAHGPPTRHDERSA